jgi:hypothetical protein
MKHDMNKRILLRSEEYILRKYRFKFFGLSIFLVISYIYMDRLKNNKKLNLKSEIQKIKEKQENDNSFFDPSINNKLF